MEERSTLLQSPKNAGVPFRSTLKMGVEVEPGFGASPEEGCTESCSCASCWPDYTTKDAAGSRFLRDDIGKHKTKTATRGRWVAVLVSDKRPVELWGCQPLRGERFSEVMQLLRQFQKWRDLCRWQCFPARVG